LLELIWYEGLELNKAVRVKRELDGFWRAPNQIFDFKPFIFPLKNNKY
jgi:hypothetical protein